MCDVDYKKGEEAVLSVTKEYGKERAIFIKTDVTQLKDLQGQLSICVQSVCCACSNAAICLCTHTHTHTDRTLLRSPRK
jgi:hypothetical protein